MASDIASFPRREWGGGQGHLLILTFRPGLSGAPVVGVFRRGLRLEVAAFTIPQKAIRREGLKGRGFREMQNTGP